MTDTNRTTIMIGTNTTRVTHTVCGNTTHQVAKKCKTRVSNAYYMIWKISVVFTSNPSKFDSSTFQIGKCNMPHFSHGSMTPRRDMYDYGEKVYYKCQEGYKMYYENGGREYSTCMSSGKWNNEPPMCRSMYMSKYKLKIR